MSSSTKHQQEVNLGDPDSPDSDFPEEENGEPAVENLAIGNLGIDKLVAERLAAGTLAAEKLVTEKLAAVGLAAEKPATEKLAAEKLAAEKLAVEKPAAEKSVSQESEDKFIPTGEEIGKRLKNLIKSDRKGLQKIYPGDDAELDKILKAPTERGEEMARKLVMEMGCSGEIAKDLTVLTLYDVAILIDDSDSMIGEENGKRKKTLIEFVDHITDIYQMANKSGILAMRFLNGSRGKKNWTGRSQKYLDRHTYSGLTKIGTELKEKILDIYAIKNAKQSKPLLVLIVTDGAVEGERKGHLKKVIRDCVNERERAGKGFDAVSFQFSRIGNDPGAAQLLIDLDEDTDLGEFIDVLPVEFDLERQLQDKWFVLPKILLGAILPGWDKQDDHHQTEEPDLVADRVKDSKGPADFLEDSDDDDENSGTAE
ncbi:hypothetical protein B9Z19DRAFT_1045931 [Tuber borchii]|uniref:VWFA domain-containing protein n=1 Tax=Tuber borchii TaxID=42251 RepID=A0A2T6ZWJ7_TUBBO|nr:hypothetical protein B9Z19DRAFT_1045931 [Tuber borchii]